jgi:hypothetical protein
MSYKNNSLMKEISYLSGFYNIIFSRSVNFSRFYLLDYHKDNGFLNLFQSLLPEILKDYLMK